MKKILTILGARPQFIKAAAVSRIIKVFSSLKEIIVHTGQHYDFNMSEIFFDEMDIPRPHYNLEINGVGHGAMTGRMLEKIEEVIKLEKPDLVMVYGDTNSTLAGSLAASKLHIKIAHVEAGLRSYNMRMPEEINRILTDRISSLLFCPTDQSVANLRKEGFDDFDCHIFQVGDVMYDAALYYGQISGKHSNILNKLNLNGKDFILASVHRQENTDDLENLKEIITALNVLSKEIQMVFPIHPRTRALMEQNNIQACFDTIEPVGYFDILELLKHCRLVITDSGGMQKEAFFFEKYCLTLRNETEWIELTDAGYNQLCGANRSAILSGFTSYCNKAFHKAEPLYGTGNAASEIVSILAKQ